MRWPDRTSAQQERIRKKTVHDFKELHARFSEWSDGDLKQIPVVPESSRLEQNATYIDLMAATPHEFTATGSMMAGGIRRRASIDQIINRNKDADWIHGHTSPTV
jgi:hypothetical protein